jgi:hypothetical protein
MKAYCDIISKANPDFITSKLLIIVSQHCTSTSTKVVASQPYVSNKNLRTYLFISFPFKNTGGSTHAMYKLMKILELIQTNTFKLLKYSNTSTHLPCCANP